MRRRSRAGGEPVKARSRKTATPKRRAAPKPTPDHGLSAASLQEQLDRRTRELSEALEQQTATSEVLRIISSTPGDLEPVFQTILANATRICEARFGNLWLREGDNVRIAATHGAPSAYREYLKSEPVVVPVPGSTVARVIADREVVQIDDITKAPTHGMKMRLATIKLAEARSLVGVPMLKENEAIGAIGIYRQEVRPFSEKQIELLKNFASQAVIAIENARLLNELRQRTTDLTERSADLTEALEQQTATSDVLQVISSSPGDLQPVFATMVENAVRICHAKWGNIHRWDGETLHLVASHNVPPAFATFRRSNPHYRPHPKGLFGRLAATQKVTQMTDSAAVEAYTERLDPVHVAAVELGGARTTLGVPMLKENQLIGAVALIRQEVRPFTEKQIALVENFAAQAVIAVENARLLNELRERTADLTESLEQQTATSEVLRVISSSPGELEPVFNAMLENATRICDAKFGVLQLLEGDGFRTVALHNAPPAFADYVRRGLLRPGPNVPLSRMTRTKQVVHVADITMEEAYIERDPLAVAGADLGGYRTILAVPMLKESELIGGFVIFRQEVRPFTDKQIALVQNFAAQAVIAIENTRLLSELRQSLQQQTATADVLKVISRSTFDLRTVLQTLVESAARLCDADKGNITREKDGVFYRAAESYGYSREFLDHIKGMPIETDRGSATGRALFEGRVIHIPDVKVDQEYTLVEAQKLGDYRTVLAVPMLREGVALGVLTLTRSDVRPFTDKQIELVTTFADQAAIAIENVRLFDSVEARTRELAKSLEDLRNAQDRLVQTEKLASLGQLTAGIAHEIKNPLNFVNNFSTVTVELIDELQEAMQDIQISEKKRTEIKDLVETMQGNLDKVVQHGKRADAIVKNMLLHSRQGSGEHRLVDLNTLVDESLNLAYHGARAEKQGFTITLERSFDPTAGEVDVFPQDITRVLLNLISNGFYAATKRSAETDGGDHEPTLSAATKDLGDRVEIRIRDNGTGIPAGVKDKMFNPFFTTKPAGEGTGLGLSISHDIIVKQHAGAIEVETEPGKFTEFRIVLPRTAASLAKSGGRA
jgi:two-component system, NtrC family, sensor kinase